MEIFAILWFILKLLFLALGLFLIKIGIKNKNTIQIIIGSIISIVWLMIYMLFQNF